MATSFDPSKVLDDGSDTVGFHVVLAGKAGSQNATFELDHSHLATVCGVSNPAMLNIRGLNITKVKTTNLNGNKLARAPTSGLTISTKDGPIPTSAKGFQADESGMLHTNHVTISAGLPAFVDVPSKLDPKSMKALYEKHVALDKYDRTMNPMDGVTVVKTEGKDDIFLTLKQDPSLPKGKSNMAVLASTPGNQNMVHSIFTDESGREHLVFKEAEKIAAEKVLAEHLLSEDPDFYRFAAKTIPAPSEDYQIAVSGEVHRNLCFGEGGFIDPMPQPLPARVLSQVNVDAVGGSSVAAPVPGHKGHIAPFTMTELGRKPAVAEEE
jgi:hypothetical protein